MRDRTALVLADKAPFLREGRGGSSRRRTTCPLFMPTAIPMEVLLAWKLEGEKKIFDEIRVAKFHRCIHRPKHLFQVGTLDKWNDIG